MNLIRRVTKCRALTLRDGENFHFEKLNSLRERILFFIWGSSYGTGNRGDQEGQDLERTYFYTIFLSTRKATSIFPYNNKIMSKIIS